MLVSVQFGMFRGPVCCLRIYHSIHPKLYSFPLLHLAVSPGFSRKTRVRESEYTTVGLYVPRGRKPEGDGEKCIIRKLVSLSFAA